MTRCIMPRDDKHLGQEVRSVNVRHLCELPSEQVGSLGDVTYARLLNRSIIILDSVKAAQDLIEKGGVKYADRHYSTLIADL